jgi:hypothetical protein|eukprot:COSAG02_NODE_2562_length_8527_cov_24.422995_6_plen_71_part_00
MRSADQAFEMPNIWHAGLKANRPETMHTGGRWALVTAEHAARVQAQGGAPAVRPQPRCLRLLVKPDNTVL